MDYLAKLMPLNRFSVGNRAPYIHYLVPRHKHISQSSSSVTYEVLHHIREIAFQPIMMQTELFDTFPD